MNLINLGLSPQRLKRVETLLIIQFPLNAKICFGVFRHENKEEISFSLTIGIDDENEEFFTKLGERMAELAYEQKGKIPKSFKPSDLELVKTTESGKYKNVYARIYTSKSGKVNCNLSERMCLQEERN